MIDQRDDPTWRIASNGSLLYRYGIARFAGREWLEDSHGFARRFGSPEAAQGVIDKEQLNAATYAPAIGGFNPVIYFKGERHQWAGVYESAAIAQNVAVRLLNSAKECGFVS